MGDCRLWVAELLTCQRCSGKMIAIGNGEAIFIRQFHQILIVVGKTEIHQADCIVRLGILLEMFFPERIWHTVQDGTIIFHKNYSVKRGFGPLDFCMQEVCQRLFVVNRPLRMHSEERYDYYSVSGLMKYWIRDVFTTALRL